MADTRPPAAPFTQTLAFRLLLAANLMARPFVECIGPEHDLTLAEWRALIALSASPGLANVEVAEATGLDQMGISRALDRLERMGRVVRRRDPADRRRTVNTLTPAGLAVFETVAALARDRDRAIIDGLDPEEARLFAIVLDRIIARLRASP